MPNSERRQRTNTRGRRHLGCHDLRVFALPRLELDVFYAVVREVWCRYDLPRTLRVTSPVRFRYLTSVMKNGLRQVTLLLDRSAEVGYVFLLLETLLCTVQCGPVVRLLYSRMVYACSGYGVLLRVPVEVVTQRFLFTITWTLGDKTVNLVLGLVVLARVADVNKAVKEGPVWFPYSEKGNTLVIFWQWHSLCVASPRL